MGTKGLEEGGKVRTFPGSEGWRGVLVGWLSVRAAMTRSGWTTCRGQAQVPEDNRKDRRGQHVGQGSRGAQSDTLNGQRP